MLCQGLVRQLALRQARVSLCLQAPATVLQAPLATVQYLKGTLPAAKRLPGSATALSRWTAKLCLAADAIRCARPSTDAVPDPDADSRSRRVQAPIVAQEVSSLDADGACACKRLQRRCERSVAAMQHQHKHRRGLPLTVW